MNRVDKVYDLELESMLLTRHLLPLRQPGSEHRRLERSGYTLLSRIRAGGPMSIGELSDALGLDVSTLNRQTAALRKAGCLERVPDPEGGIARKFRVTAVGVEQLASDRKAAVDGLGRVLEHWPDQDIDTLVTLLRTFNGDIERLGKHPWPREQSGRAGS